MASTANLMGRRHSEVAVPSGESAPIAKRRFRDDLLARGGGSCARCYQCATCTSVCELVTADHLFPRRQMLWAQWGMEDKLTGDPSVWLCHQCNDCSERCPRDARPGDIMQAIRSKTVEAVAAPQILGRLVAVAAYSWPLLLGLPILFWVLLVGATNGFTPPKLPLIYGDVVPHWMIYLVFFPATGFAALTALMGARRLWQRWGRGVTRSGSFIRELVAVSIEIMAHRRFSSCGPARPRRRGHFLLFWGFAGAAITSGFLVVAMYGFGMDPPLPQTNWMKILGNISAVFLLLGLLSILAHRLQTGDPAGGATAFDNFFLALVALLVATGILTEVGRFFFEPTLAIFTYIVHLGTVLALFLTFPYSKLAHLVYRTLAMVHERMVAAPEKR